MPLLRLLVPLLLMAAAGCAVVDPHNIIGRHNAGNQAANTPVPMRDATWRADALETVWRTIDERYYDPKLNGVDWRAVRMRYEPLLKATASDDDYWELLDKMAGELKDSHTRVESPKQVQQQRDQESHSLGISFIELDGKLVLTSVHPESDAYWAGARAGMAIRTIDGQDALAHYRSLAAAARESSTAFAKARGAQRKINNGAIGSKLSMVFERPDGSGIEATLERRRFGNPPFVMHRILPSGYGYIRFSGFNESLRSGVLGAIEKLAATPGLILDLRNNGGGSGNMADAILARFFESEQKGMKILTRTGKPVSVFFIDVVKTEPIIKGSGKAAYTKPLVLITNGNSASASEIVAAALQDLGRAQVVGERTCGCLLGFLGHADLPGGGQLAYSEIGFVTNKGRRIEGEGVLPDVEVKPGVEDYRLNRDRALEQAQALLQRKIAAERVQ